MRRALAVVGLLLVIGGALGLVLDRQPHGDKAACRSAYHPMVRYATATNAVQNSTATREDELPIVVKTRKSLIAASKQAAPGGMIARYLGTFADDVASMRVAWLGGNGLDDKKYMADASSLISACGSVDPEWRSGAG